MHTTAPGMTFPHRTSNPMVMLDFNVIVVRQRGGRFEIFAVATSLVDDPTPFPFGLFLRLLLDECATDARRTSHCCVDLIGVLRDLVTAAVPDHVVLGSITLPLPAFCKKPSALSRQS